MSEQIYPVFPGADPGDIHNYLLSQGVVLDGVSIVGDTIVIDAATDVSSYMTTLANRAAAKEQQYQTDINRLQVFLLSSQDATLSQLNAVVRSLIRVVRAELQE